MNAVIGLFNHPRRAPDQPHIRHWRKMCRLVLCILFINVASTDFSSADEQPQDVTVRALSEVVKQIKAKYVGTIDDRKLTADAIRGMMQGLDPFSDYIEPEAYSELRQENGGKFTGLGMEVEMEAGAVRVVSTFDDSPAFRAGLRPGDLITRLNETSVEGMTLSQAIQRVRGQPDTSIALTVLRQGDTEPRMMSLKRAIIQSRAIKSTVLGTGYGYIRIAHFNQRTAESMMSALADMARHSDGALKGILLDLRDNPGGLLKSAVAVSSAFLPEDTLVVYTEGAAVESRMRLKTSVSQSLHATDPDILKNFPDLKTLPLVVLVNGGSASAAEIVAGALQDHRRATVVGTQTFGKGSIQVLLPLRDGAALKLTTAYYFTPNGQRIHGIGLTPDKIIDQPAVAVATDLKAVVSETTADKAGKSNTCTAWDRLGAQDAALLNAISYNGDDCQLGRAMDLLRQLPALAGG
jgi:carboxyl-terminal processing protease